MYATQTFNVNELLISGLVRQTILERNGRRGFVKICKVDRILWDFKFLHLHLNFKNFKSIFTNFNVKSIYYGKKIFESIWSRLLNNEKNAN